MTTTTPPRPVQVITCEHGDDCFIGCICVCGLNRRDVEAKARGHASLSVQERDCWSRRCGR